jgi:superoxide dismutase, Cu-Zn family
MRTHRHISILAAAVVAACSSAPLQQGPSAASAAAATASPPVPGITATAAIRDASGTRVGTATLTDSHAGVIVDGTVSGIGLGSHGIHVHETGKCEPPFATAGGHFNPEHKHHGFKTVDGPHLGDLPNIDTPAAGELRFEFLLPGVTLTGANALLDADGAAIVIHAGRDDYATDPAGGSGARIACGVITR